jgi:hypothetical protein
VPRESENGKERKRRGAPWDEMACLEMAVGIVGCLLVLVPALLSHWVRHPGMLAVALALVAGPILVAVGGNIGSKEHGQQRGLAVMTAGGAVLTLAAIGMLIASRWQTLGWDFPLGIILLSLALVSDWAAFRFRRKIRTTASEVV